MPRSFLVKKNVKWRRMYRKLQIGLAKTGKEEVEERLHVDN